MIGKPERKDKFVSLKAPSSIGFNVFGHGCTSDIIMHVCLSRIFCEGGAASHVHQTLTEEWSWSCSKEAFSSYTPRKINMEPENHLFEEENHLNQTFMTLGFKMIIFGGVHMNLCVNDLMFPSTFQFAWWKIASE